MSPQLPNQLEMLGIKYLHRCRRQLYQERMREGDVERERRERLRRCRRLLSKEFMSGHGVEMQQIKYLRRCRRQLH